MIAEQRGSAYSTNLEAGGGFGDLNHSDSEINSMKGLKMACLDINGPLPKIDHLKVSCVESKIDIMTISETKLESSGTDNELQITTILIFFV